MSKEIIAAVRELEEAKGIDGEVLLTALEDALLAAYKKTPHAADHARVVLDFCELSGGKGRYGAPPPAALRISLRAL